MAAIYIVCYVWFHNNTVVQLYCPGVGIVGTKLLWWEGIAA